MFTLHDLKRYDGRTDVCTKLSGQVRDHIFINFDVQIMTNPFFKHHNRLSMTLSKTW